MNVAERLRQHLADAREHGETFEERAILTIACDSDREAMSGDHGRHSTRRDLVAA